jgi:hypothetical protein
LTERGCHDGIRHLTRGVYGIPDLRMPCVLYED